MTARTIPTFLLTSASAAHALAAAFSHAWVIGRLGRLPVRWQMPPPVNDNRPAPPHSRRSQTSLSCSVSTLARASATRSAVNVRNHRTGVSGAAVSDGLGDTGDLATTA